MVRTEVKPQNKQAMNISKPGADMGSCVSVLENHTSLDYKQSLQWAK